MNYYYYFYQRFKENLNLIYGVCVNFIWFDVEVQFYILKLTWSLFGSTFMIVSTDINTCETVWENLWKQLMTCP